MCGTGIEDADGDGRVSLGDLDRDNDGKISFEGGARLPPTHPR